MPPGKNESPFNQIHSIMADAERGPDEKINSLLRFGLDAFEMDVGIVSKIEGTTYTVLYAQPTSVGLETGTTFDLGVTYCSLTIRVTMPLAIAHMSVSEHRRHPCYEAFRLESYIGARYSHPYADYATVNFSSSMPHITFSSQDRVLINSIAVNVEKLLATQPV